ncbi:MAG TPA: hypothetical protein VHX87_09870 [Galbitalea sp.]|nr:hypothetical protein [Galbitalea sp.]
MGSGFKSRGVYHFLDLELDDGAHYIVDCADVFDPFGAGDDGCRPRLAREWQESSERRNKSRRPEAGARQRFELPPIETDW